jgi:hypothetical protein
MENLQLRRILSSLTTNPCLPIRLNREAILEFNIASLGSGTELRLCTRFRPRGLYGMLYWYALLPFHDLLFGGMLKQVAKRVDRPIIDSPQKFNPSPIS